MTAYDRQFTAPESSKHTRFRTIQFDKAPVTQSSIFHNDKIQSNNVFDLLRQNQITKHDLYFMKQEKLMRNAALPIHERDKIYKKMNFQSNHSDMLSIPASKNVREKFQPENDCQN